MVIIGLLRERVSNMGIVMFNKIDTNNLLLDLSVDMPIERLLENIIFLADSISASDVHIYVCYENTSIKFRCNGILTHVSDIPLEMAKRLSSRIKILANMDISEQRLPQDGHFVTSIKRDLNIRVNSCPTIHGEKLVLRIARHYDAIPKLNEIGMSEKQTQEFQRALSQMHGLILLTGPTGSGKTTTLYAALNELDDDRHNILTIEDPVEITHPRYTQVSINKTIGFDFPQALRAFLRQDPDIIMIGEIRDLETATISCQAAQTGHLVLATLHCNSANQAISRLKAIGVQEYLIQDAIKLVISQQLPKQVDQDVFRPNERIPKFDLVTYDLTT